MKKRLQIIIFGCLLMASNLGFSQDSWRRCQEAKEGSINVRYFNNPTFIQNIDGEMTGIEFEIWELFKDYVDKNYEVELSINYIQEKSFGELYNNVKSGRNGNFGACSFSITEERSKEVDFTPKYMPDIEVLISSSNYPVFTDSTELRDANGTFVIVGATTYEEDFKQIRPWLNSPSVFEVSEAAEVKKLLNDEDGYFGFIELPNYFLSIQDGYNFKRQNIFKIEREGYAFIQPKSSDWREVLDLFFLDSENVDLINEILKKYLGEDVKDLLLTVDEAYKDEIMLLTKEKELQEKELQNRQLQLENAALEKAQRDIDFKVSQEASFRTQFILVISIIFLVSLIVIIYVAFRNKKKSNNAVKEKNVIVEKQLVEISDSIKYAQHLQQAILPKPENLKNNLGEGFVMFEPKNVVSGDFYWMEQVGDRTYFAVADCTGHGVPGALVSVVCGNALNRAIKEFAIVEPCKILDKTRELVIETFSKSGKIIQDGMDIALCMRMGNKLVFCGANNPLWIIRKNEVKKIEGGFYSPEFVLDDRSLVEVKGNKQPVGSYERIELFQQSEITLHHEDIIYIFSDGYADQFGGSQGKKFKYKRLKSLLLDSCLGTMNQQQDELEKVFEKWKGNLDQIDDVTIIGVRLK